jgi:pimeloyl-ACP methyl ester carboxylesterase
VAVAFGGTVFKSGKDWKSNLRWFIPHHNDEYTQIVNEFGPAFVKEVVRREQEPEWAFLSNAKIYATGHSLGGGLAQQFAYSLPLDSRVPRVSKVFAFDPSPVTGFYSLPENTRNENSNGLEIDRIYERGEILALLRSLENFVYPASAINPKIRQVRYNLFSRRPISGHSMTDLACKLIEASR